MDSTKVLGLLEQLDDEIDDLEESLSPLIETALSETTSTLPLLDKAKLYVLVTYAIESMLFSYLRLNGVKAREHPVFVELTRVKQYFDKIKSAAEPVAPRTSTLDKAAAARFINPGLAAAEKEALRQAEEQAKTRARAHIKFNELSREIENREMSNKRKAAASKAGPVGENSTPDSDSSSGSEEETSMAPLSKSHNNDKKKRKVEKQSGSGQKSNFISRPTSGASRPGEKPAKKKPTRRSKKGGKSTD